MELSRAVFVNVGTVSEVLVSDGNVEVVSSEDIDPDVEGGLIDLD